MIDDLFKCINLSKFTVIGYNSSSEYEKDLILKKLNSYNISEVYENFNPKQIHRNSILNSILNNKDYTKSNYFHLDINDILVNKDVSYFTSKKIADIIRSFKSNIDNFNFILTTQIYKTFDNKSILKGGSSMLYLADFVFNLEKENNKIKIIKSRYYQNNIDISLSELENFNYICNHELNK